MYFLLTRKEGNALFNDALNTYGVKHMVNDHSGSERENPLSLHGILFYLRLYGVRHTVKDHQRGNPLQPLHELLYFD